MLPSVLPDQCLVGVGHGGDQVSVFPSPTTPYPSRTEVLLGYLTYFRSVVVDKLHDLPPAELRTSRLPSRWTPLQLIHHLTFVERRWLVWGFEGEAVAHPWGDQRDGTWYVDPAETLDSLLASLRQQAERTRAVALAHELDEVGRPGERWDGAAPATLERVLLHLLQEYARHAGHLDGVRELVDGAVGE